MAEYEQARERGEQVIARRRCRTTGPPRSAARNAPNESWPSWAGSNPLALEESLRWRNATTSCPPNSRTSRLRRKDLLDVVAERCPDPAGVRRSLHRRGTRILEVFAALFPGGEGRLRLTDPDDISPPASRWRHVRPAKDQAAVAAVRRREGADRGRDARGDLPGPPVAVQHHGRGRGGARRQNQHRRARLVRTAATSMSQPTETTHQKPTMEVADAPRVTHTRGRHHRSDLPADARPAGRPAGTAVKHRLPTEATPECRCPMTIRRSRSCLPGSPTKVGAWNLSENLGRSLPRSSSSPSWYWGWCVIPAPDRLSAREQTPPLIPPVVIPRRRESRSAELNWPPGRHHRAARRR